MYTFTFATCNATRNLIPPYELQTTRPFMDLFSCMQRTLSAPGATYTNLGFVHLGNNISVDNDVFTDPFQVMTRFTEIPYDVFPSVFKTYEFWISIEMSPLPYGSYELFNSYQTVPFAGYGFKVTYTRDLSSCDFRDFYLELDGVEEDRVQAHFPMILFQNATGLPSDFLESALVHSRPIHFVFAYLGLQRFRVCIGVQGLLNPVCIDTIDSVNLVTSQTTPTTYLNETTQVIAFYQTTVFDAIVPASYVQQLFNNLVFVAKTTAAIFT